MNKLIYPDANEELFHALEGRFVTLIDTDKFYTNVKTASSNAITRQMLDECKPDKDHFLVHFVGVGDFEKYGFNKNADAYPKKANETRYKTFETHAHLFREHNSDHPSKAIGQIKKAMYNPEMGRIEMAAWVNIKKAAEEYEKAKSGETLSSSLGCHIPFDRDNISGKLSKTPREYEPWMRSRPGQYIDEWDGRPIHKYAFVFNDEPTYFDLSIVAKPAERIAHYLEYRFNNDEEANKLIKAASEGRACIPSALLPELEHIKFSNAKKLPFGKQALLTKLAKLENEFINVITGKDRSNTLTHAYMKHAALNSFFRPESSTAIKFRQKLAALKSVRPETLFRELAKRASVLSFNDFMDVVYKDSDTIKDKDTYHSAVKYAQEILIPEIFKNLSGAVDSVDPFDDGCCDSEALFDACGAVDAMMDPTKDPVQHIMDEVEEQTSLEPKIRGDRTAQVIITVCLSPSGLSDLTDKLITIKSASSQDPQVVKLAKRFANEYGLYKLSALNDISNIKGADFLDDAALITSIAQNFTALL